MSGSETARPTPDAAGRGARARYTVRFRLEPTGQHVEYRAVTTFGELKAVAMATDRLMWKNPDARFSTVEVVTVEKEFSVDPAEDALDHWGLD